MHQFNLPLESGTDASTNLPVFGFTINEVFIHDPFSSGCGRFQVDPTEAYGLTHEDATQLAALNKLLGTATQDALNEGCFTIQTALGIPSGDVAGVYFSGPDEVAPIARALLAYILMEYRFSQA